MRIMFGLLVIVFAAGANPAAADSPSPTPAPTVAATGADGAATAPLPAAEPTAALADIPENQAEREALLRGELELSPVDGAAPVPAADPAREARRAAIDAVLADQDARIQALADRLAASSGEQSLVLQREIEREKLATGRRLLEVQLQFATRDGDPARIEQIQAALTAWDAPPPAGTPVDRPATDNRNR